MTPGEAIHKHCIECVGTSYQVKDCQGDALLDGTAYQFFKYRLGKGRASVKTIRKFCLHCMCGNSQAVSERTTKDCLLYPYRLGKNPAYALSDIRKEELARRLKKTRLAKDIQQENRGFTKAFLV